MTTRQTDTRVEFQVRIRTPFGNIRTEWRLTREAAEALRADHDVVSIDQVRRTLDY
jgi:hypothetical protein